MIAARLVFILLLVGGCSTNRATREPPETVEPKFSVSLSGAHYDLQSTASTKDARALLDFMEQVRETYLEFLRPEDREETDKRRSTIVLYKEREEFLATHPPEQAGAYFDGRRLVGRHDETFMRGYFAHEGFHQCFEAVTGRSAWDTPFWFSEGMADCFGSCQLRDGKVCIDAIETPIARTRLVKIQSALHANSAKPLFRMLSMEREEFMRDSVNSYAQSWSFCHFLLNGEHRRNLEAYYDSIRHKEVDHETAWDRSFKDIPKSRLEEEWKKYVLALRFDSKSLGIECRDITAAEGVELEKGYSGIRVERVLPYSVASQGGIQDHDILIGFNERRFRRSEGIDHLQQWTFDAPRERPIKVLILRDGRRLELTVLWPRP